MVEHVHIWENTAPTIVTWRKCSAIIIEVVDYMQIIVAGEHHLRHEHVDERLRVIYLGHALQ